MNQYKGNTIFKNNLKEEEIKNINQTNDYNKFILENKANISLTTPSIRSNYSINDNNSRNNQLLSLEKDKIKNPLLINKLENQRNSSISKTFIGKSTNESHSINSQISSNSRNPLQRPLSVNNNEHLFVLSGKEENLRNGNLITVSNFLQSLESSKKNVIRNMSDNFVGRVQEIWISYLTEQGQSTNLMDSNLENDLKNIKEVFLDLLLAKTEHYVEELRKNTLINIFENIKLKNKQVEYKNQNINNVINIFDSEKQKNIILKRKLITELSNANNQINLDKEKYKKAKISHINQYEREFLFKMSSDSELSINTLIHCIPQLEQHLKELDNKIAINQNSFEYESKLDAEVNDLEREFDKLKNLYL